MLQTTAALSVPDTLVLTTILQPVLQALAPAFQEHHLIREDPMFWQIVLEGFDNLRGKPFSELIVCITRNASLKFVSLTHFEGAGILNPIRRFEERAFFRVEEFVPAISQLIQVDWATLVLSKAGLEKTAADDYEARFARLLVDGLTVVRCVDGQFVYIYTGDNVVKEYVCENYECQTIDRHAPQSFEWPE